MLPKYFGNLKKKKKTHAKPSICVLGGGRIWGSNLLCKALVKYSDWHSCVVSAVSWQVSWLLAPWSSSLFILSHCWRRVLHGRAYSHSCPVPGSQTSALSTRWLSGAQLNSRSSDEAPLSFKLTYSGWRLHAQLPDLKLLIFCLMLFSLPILWFAACGESQLWVLQRVDWLILHLLVLMVAMLGTSSYLCRSPDMKGTEVGSEENRREGKERMEQKGVERNGEQKKMRK